MLDLDRHRGRSRVLALVAPHGGHAALRRQLGELSARRDDLARGDVRVMTATGAAADALRRAYRIGGDEFRAVLLGRDGRAEMIRAEPVAADEVLVAGGQAGSASSR